MHPPMEVITMDRKVETTLEMLEDTLARLNRELDKAKANKESVKDYSATWYWEGRILALEHAIGLIKIDIKSIKRIYEDEGIK